MNFKTVLMAAAVVGAATTAQAADLAKKAPAAANYVKVCDAYGAGFFYIPGSETCLKIGGYAQAQYNMYWHSRAGAIGGGLFGWHRGENGISTGARAHLNLDARTSTEMGLLRSYIDIEANANSYGVGTGVVLKQAFVQFGPLTAGRATSFFDFFNGDYTQNAVFEAAHADANVNLLAYTFAFGNGITATLSIEDPSTSDDGGRRNTLGGAGGPAGWAPYGGVHTPDLVANVNISQAWGSAQIMGALHENTTWMHGVNGKIGWAVGAGVKVNLPALGPTTQVALQAAYSKGALAYVSPSIDGITTGVVTGGYSNDFEVAGGSIRQNTAWGVAAGFTHGLTKTLTANLEASYLKGTLDGALANDATLTQYDIIANVSWAPVAGLAITPELEYRNVNYSSVINAAGQSDASALIGVLRVRRTF